MRQNSTKGDPLRSYRKSARPRLPNSQSRGKEEPVTAKDAVNTARKPLSPKFRGDRKILIRTILLADHELIEFTNQSVLNRGPLCLRVDQAYDSQRS